MNLGCISFHGRFGVASRTIKRALKNDLFAWQVLARDITLTGTVYVFYGGVMYRIRTS